MIGEVHPTQRGQLEQALDMFEDAMARSDRALFDSARQSLLMVFSSLGIEYDETSTD